MIVTRRIPRKGSTPPQCEAPGCTRSASQIGEVFPGYRDQLCRKCAKEWSEAYDNAYSNWEAEAREEYDARNDSAKAA